MPWTPGYQTDRVGLGEARIDALVALIQSKVGDLNTTLQLTPMSMPAGSAVSAQIKFGDRYSFPKVAAYPFVVCVMGGGRNNGIDRQVSNRVSAGPTVTTIHFSHAVHTRIRVYVHPDTFPTSLPATDAEIDLQVEKRERLVQRVVDWLCADVLETTDAFSMLLASREMSETGDKLISDGFTPYIDVSVGVFEKSFGNTMLCQGAEISISAFAQGG